MTETGTGTGVDAGTGADSTSQPLSVGIDLDRRAPPPPPFRLSHSSLALRASLVRQVAEARRLLAGAPDDDVVASRQERQVTILVRTTKRR